MENMIELCFSDSVKGALRCAQHCDSDGGGVSGIATIGGSDFQEKKQKKIPKQNRCHPITPLDSEYDDVLGLSLNLSCGDIAEPLSVSCRRQKLIHQWLTADPWGELENVEAQAQEHWQNCLNDYEQLRIQAAKKPVRIWTDYTPDSLCGLLFAADILYKLDTAVTCIPLPLWTEEPDGVIRQFDGWGCVCPEEFGRFVPGGVALSKNVLRLLAGRWKELQEENAPLRAFVNGRVVSVNADFYDDFIRQSFIDGEMQVAQIIGRVLSRRPGVGDWIITERIRHMLRSGELRMVQEDSRRFWRSTVMKT